MPLTTMPLTLSRCSVTRSSIKILFSHPVDQTIATTVANYQVSCPSIDEVQPSQAALEHGNTSVTLTFPDNVAFAPGELVTVKVSNVTAKDEQQSKLQGGSAIITGQVRDRSRTGTTMEGAITYPVLTEEIGYPPSPLAGGGAPAGPGGGGGVTLGLVAAKAVTDVLGWKASAADPKGFVGALSQSFTLTEVDGHTESRWTPRTYAVQTDLAGGITGAQASLYSRAKDALDHCIPLLDGLHPLDPETDLEYVKALREMAKSQMNEIVKQLGAVGGPSVLRVETYFSILLSVTLTSSQPPTDADKLDGKCTLGSLRDTFGIGFAGNPFSNSVEDEQNITNFRIIVDYMLSLWQSWINNRSYFLLGQSNGEAFLGTQLVLISRQFSVIAETVNEVRFALDSVFIGRSERQTLLLQFADPNTPPMFVEDVLQEIEDFATEEGPRLIRDGGRLAVNNNLLPVIESLRKLVEQTRAPFNIDTLPDGFKTARVRNAIDDLQDQLSELANLSEPVGRDVPPPEAPLPPGVPGPPKGGLLVLPPSLNFGEVQIGSSSTQAVTIANLTSHPVSITDISIQGEEFKKSEVIKDSIQLAPMATTVVSVTFSPGAKNIYGGQLTFKVDGAERTVALSGRGRSVAVVTARRKVAA
jgi:hypothetical protein